MGAQEGCRTSSAPRASRPRREQTVQVLVGQAAAVVALPGELAAVMLGQCARIRLDGLYPGAIAHRRTASPYPVEELVDGAQLLERRPVGVALAPAGPRRQPDGEGFCEVLGRVRLRIPLPEVVDVTAATRSRLVAGGVLEGRGSEDLPPALSGTQAVCVVEGMS